MKFTIKKKEDNLFHVYYNNTWITLFYSRHAAIRLCLKYANTCRQFSLQYYEEC